MYITAFASISSMSIQIEALLFLEENLKTLILLAA